MENQEREPVLQNILRELQKLQKALAKATFKFNKEDPGYKIIEKALAEAYFLRPKREFSDTGLRRIMAVLPQKYHEQEPTIIITMRKMLKNLQQNERRHVEAREARYRKFEAYLTEDITIHLCQTRHVRVREGMVKEMTMLRKFNRERSFFDNDKTFYAAYRNWRSKHELWDLSGDEWDRLVDEDKDHYSQLIVPESDEE